MTDKFIAIINGKEYKVGYPKCQGCANLCFPYPVSCCFDGVGCEYPEARIKAESMEQCGYCGKTRLVEEMERVEIWVNGGRRIDWYCKPIPGEWEKDHNKVSCASAAQMSAEG